jgi:hypothetical protein
MTTTTDFSWTDPILEWEHEREDLLTALENGKTCGDFEVERKGSQLFVRYCGGDDWLRLASDKAVRAFIGHVRSIRGLNGPDDPDVAYQRAIENPHS